MAGPKDVTIRTYQVGFGDCFLLTFRYAGSKRRHVLVDFGTTGIPDDLEVDAGVHMLRIAKEIAKDCGADPAQGRKGKLHAVVATHRHRDHISGFATSGKNKGSGGIIAGLEPDVVVQPWTEHPDAARDALEAPGSGQGLRRARAGLDAMHAVARAAWAYARAELRRPGGPSVSRRMLERLAFVGEDNVKNVSAVRSLIAMGKREGATPVYASYGSDAGLGALLPGVNVTVLGPPTLTQTPKTRRQTDHDDDEFWHLLAGPRRSHARQPLLEGLGLAVGGGPRARGQRRGKRPGKGGAAPALPPQARWFADRLERLRGAHVLEIVTALDKAMNNTSLILLFEFGGRKLLFPGDAQLENWTWAMKDAPERDANVKLLEDLDLYKVGHHGSLNATPKTLLWAHLRKRGAAGAGRLRAVLSTMPGRHPGAGEGEVPRGKLVTALLEDTDLISTDDRSVFAQGKVNPTLCHAITIRAKS